MFVALDNTSGNRFCRVPIHPFLSEEIMALNPMKSNFVVGLTAGLVAAAVAPVLLPALKRGSRPFAKGLIKGGVLLYEKGREAAANAGEMVEDVMAEIHAEEAQAQMAPMEAENGTVGRSRAEPYLSALKQEAQKKEQGSAAS